MKGFWEAMLFVLSEVFVLTLKLNLYMIECSPKLALGTSWMEVEDGRKEEEQEVRSEHEL